MPGSHGSARPPTALIRGVVPPIPTPMRDDGSVDLEGLRRLVEFEIGAGVQALWVLGTTGRFDLVTDDDQLRVAERVCAIAAGRVPLILNVSDLGTRRTLARAARFDHLPFDAYAALPPWYQVMKRSELTEYFTRLAHELARPLFIYNAPWVNNMLGFEHLRDLAAHPRIVGVKDVTPSLTRIQQWPRSERQALGFSYLHGTNLLALSAELGGDGFVSSLAAAFPELAVAIWDAVQAGDLDRAGRLQTQFVQLAPAVEVGPGLACLEVAFRHRGVCDRISASPQSRLDYPQARTVIEIIEGAGILPREPILER